MSTVYKGEDKSLSITIEDDLGVLQSIDAMEDLIVVVYSGKNRAVRKDFRKVATVGYTTLERVSETEYLAIIPYTVTELWNSNCFRVEVEVIETNADFPDGFQRTKGVADAFEVEPSMITE